MALKKPPRSYSWLIWPGTILMLVLVVFVNINASHFYLKKDLTADHYFSLSSKTNDVLEAVTRKGLKVTLYVLLTPLNEAYADTKILLQQYAKSDAIEVRYMDQDRDPAGTKALLDKLKIKQNNIIIFECGPRHRYVNSVGLYEWSKRSPLDKTPATVIGFRGEEVLTSGIMSVSENAPKVLYSVNGHDERSLSNTGSEGASNFANAILQAHITIKKITTMNAPKIPDDCNLLLINRPRTAFQNAEIELIDAYLKRGGNLLLLLDSPLEIRPIAKANANLRRYFATWGVSIQNNLVIDSAQNLSGFGAGTLSAHTFGIHPVVKRMGKAPLIVTNARSITLPTDETKGDIQKEMDWTPLIRSSTKSWGETNLLNLKNISHDASDTTGPHNVAASFSRLFDKEGGGKVLSRVFIVGSSVIATNRKGVGFSHQSNADFLINSINYLTGREEVSGIGPRKPEHITLHIPRGTMRWILITVLLIMPFLVACAGLLVWFFHRVKRTRS